MRKVRIWHLLIVSVFTLLFLQSCWLNCRDTEEGPIMVLEENSYSFGEIEEGTVVVHVFNFKNCGSDTLIIRRVRGT